MHEILINDCSTSTLGMSWEVFFFFFFENVVRGMRYFVYALLWWGLLTLTKQKDDDRIQVLREEILGRGVTPEQVIDPERMTPLGCDQRLRQLPEVIDFLHIIDWSVRRRLLHLWLSLPMMMMMIWHYRLIWNTINFVIALCLQIIIT